VITQTTFFLNSDPSMLLISHHTPAPGGVPISGRSLLGLMPGNGSSRSARGSCNRTGRGTGLPWTTLSFTVALTNSEYNGLQKKVDFV
jgi:hypothetical protein